MEINKVHYLELYTHSKILFLPELMVFVFDITDKDAIWINIANIKYIRIAMTTDLNRR